MKVLEHFSIPYIGLKSGMHSFLFEVDDDFFENFEDSPIQKGKLQIKLQLDKRPDMAIASFDCQGYVVTACDRCLLDFELPIDFEFMLHIKYGEEDLDEDEVIYIDTETSKINFAQFIYEWIILSLPMIKVHQDEKNCDPIMIEKLNGNKADNNEESNIFSALKNIKFDN
jgi:uncharacterized protein